MYTFPLLGTSVDPPPNRCEICSATFADKDLLKGHLLIHLEERPLPWEMHQIGIISRVMAAPQQPDIQKPIPVQPPTIKDTKKRTVVGGGTDGFMCDVCGKHFTSLSGMTRHRQKHLDTGPPTDRKHRCTQCGYSTDNIANLVAHVRAHTGERPFRCEVCDKRFSRKTTLLSHSIVHSEERPFKCEVCGKCYKSERTLVSHERKHAPFTCDKCGESFAFLRFLRSHEQRQHTDKAAEDSSTKCDGCGQGFPSASELQSHSCPLVGGSFQCPHCPFSTDVRGSLNAHVRRMHVGERPRHPGMGNDLKCDVCNQVFSSHSELQGHQRKHRHLPQREGTFQCPHCPFATDMKGHLNAHVRRSHVGERRHECKVCGKAFFEANKLNRHLRTHSGKCVFVCGTCGLNFTDWAAWREHEKSHAGWEIFSCSACGRVFLKASDLRDHERDHLEGKVTNEPNEDQAGGKKKATGEKAKDKEKQTEFKCVACSSLFSSSADLKRHQRRLGHAPANAAFKCQHCAFSTDKKACLVSHERRMHNGERPHLCEVCGRAFFEACKLKRHLRLHTGERPFVCGTCGKGFVGGTELRRHERLHSGVLPYACGFCSKRFQLLYKLKNHEHKHRVLEPLLEEAEKEKEDKDKEKAPREAKGRAAKGRKKYNDQLEDTEEEEDSDKGEEDIEQEDAEKDKEDKDKEKEPKAKGKAAKGRKKYYDQLEDTEEEEEEEDSEKDIEKEDEKKEDIDKDKDKAPKAKGRAAKGRKRYELEDTEEEDSEEYIEKEDFVKDKDDVDKDKEKAKGKAAKGRKRYDLEDTEEEDSEKEKKKAKGRKRYNDKKEDTEDSVKEHSQKDKEEKTVTKLKGKKEKKIVKKGSFECNVCDTLFPSLPSLVRHKRRRHEKRKHRCRRCFYVTRHSSCLAAHMRRTHSHRCKLCDKAFVQKRHLDAHLRRNHSTPSKSPSPKTTKPPVPKRKNTVEIFNKEETAGSKEIDASKSDNELGSKQDSKLDNKIGNKDNSKSDNKTGSKETEDFSCSGCGKGHASSAELQKHILEEHMIQELSESTDKKGKEADERLASASEQLKRILEQQTAEADKDKEIGVFKCDSCDRIFSTLFSLKKHLKSHAKEKILEGDAKYHCPLCPDYSTAFALRLKYHLRNHFPGKPPPTTEEKGEKPATRSTTSSAVETRKVFDMVKLIQAVEKRPVLYDSSLKNYKANEIRRNAWDAVAEELCATSLLCQKKWKNCRDYYNTNRKKFLPSGSGADVEPPWAYFSLLSFLEPFVATRKSDSNFPEIMVASENIEVNVEVNSVLDYSSVEREEYETDDPPPMAQATQSSQATHPADLWLASSDVDENVTPNVSLTVTEDMATSTPIKSVYDHLESRSKRKPTKRKREENDVDQAIKKIIDSPKESAASHYGKILTITMEQMNLSPMDQVNLFQELMATVQNYKRCGR